MDPNLNLAFIMLNTILDLFKRHQQGENVTADLIELQTRVRTLLDKELAIANQTNNTNTGTSTGANDSSE